MTDENRIIIVQGAQYGSEAKGMVSLALCEERGVKWAVRTGSINAGHTVVRNRKKLAFQQLPVAAVLPDTKCVLGPGAYVHMPSVFHEMQMSGIRKENILMDRMCGVHLDVYEGEAKEAKRNLKIGATGKGCAEAIIHKIKDRGIGRPLLLSKHLVDDFVLHDTSMLLNDAYDAGESILIEGTQGTLLDFHTGPYPFVTSRQTLSASWVSESGLSPSLNYEIALVTRTYPIRVAGNSGPMGPEITWPELARRMNSRLRSFDLPAIISNDALNQFEARMREASIMYQTESEKSLLSGTSALASMDAEFRDEVMRLFETTTVTKRLRRIAELDLQQLRITVRKERPAYLALTFLNYEFPELVYTRTLHDEAMKYIRTVETAAGAPVQYVTIGPESRDMIRLR